MIQFEDRQVDIYQILSFCLGFLKRKIRILVNVFLNDKSSTPKPELITELINEQSGCQQYIQMLRDCPQVFIKEQDETQILLQSTRLFQRFVYRVKQLIRNYLPQASVSQELFVYLKKILSYSFKQGYKFENYILYLLEEIPLHLQKLINSKMQEANQKNTLKKYQKYSLENNLGRINQFREPKKYSLMNFKSTKTEKYTLDQGDNQNRSKYSNLPLDIFSKTLKPILDCLDCDISIVRGIYFNQQKEKQRTAITQDFTITFSNGNSKFAKQIENQMLYQNRFIKETIKNFDCNYAKYLIRLQKYSDQQTKIKKRCQTANFSRQQDHLSIEDSKGQKTLVIKGKGKNRENIANTQTEEDKQEMYKEIQKKNHNVLKMKNISIFASKGHLELCSQTKENFKKASFAFVNIKRAIYKNNRYTASNLKKKYEIFLKTCAEKKNNDFNLEQSNTISGEQYYARNLSILGYTENQPSFCLTMRKKKYQQKHSENECSSLCNQTIGASLENKNKIVYLRNQIKADLGTERNQIKPDLGTEKPKLNHMFNKDCPAFTDFKTTEKNIIKSGNVNHRNFNIQNRQKGLFETLNPELTVKTIRKA